MFHKALWLKDYKQSKFIIWMFLLLSFFIPVSFYSRVGAFEKDLLAHDHTYFSYDVMGSIALLQMLLLILLASALIGLERTNQSMDFTFTLPYKRTTIMLHKWMIGMTAIVGATIFNTLSCSIIFYTSPLSTYIDGYFLIYYLLVSISVLAGVYTFAILIGYLTGSLISQFLLTIIFFLLPVGLPILIDRFISNFYMFEFGQYFSANDLNFWAGLETILFPSYLVEVSVSTSTQHYRSLIFLLNPIIFILISLWISLKLAQKTKGEHNGGILLHERLIPYFRVGVVSCFFLLGGMIFSELVFWPYNFEYYLSGLFTAVLAHIILSKLLNVKIQFGKYKA